jgi:hypothetical protein
VPGKPPRAKLGLSTDQATLRATFLADMAGIWINFIQLKEPLHEISPSTLLEAWSSCFAFQCAPNQPVIDGFLVAYRGDLDGPFNISNLITIPWQTKAKSQAAETALVAGLTSPYIVEEGESEDVRQKLEHLAIWMDLGTSSGFGVA